MDTLSNLLLIASLVVIPATLVWAVLQYRKATRRQHTRRRGPAGPYRNKPKQKEPRSEKTDGFTGVSIETSESSPACEAASSIKGKIFPANGAPRLPLVDCANQQNCRCHYQRHDDRRSGERRFPSPMETSYLAQAGIQNRRSVETPRRKSDTATFESIS